MSFKRFAMLSAISYHNQQNYNNDNTNNSNNKTQTTFAPSLGTDSTKNAINSNTSAVIQIIAPIFLGNITTITTLATTSSTHLLTQPLNVEKGATTTAIKYSRHHKSGIGKSDDPLSDINDDDSSNYSEESSESSDKDHLTRPDRPPSNTYTSTTYYGSGFGVFHQQNTRSNGGGIGLISGSGSSNGHGGGSYSNGINNNVNLLLGGAMLTLITTILCVVCYCCHRNIKKRTEAAYRQQRQWLESDPNMEIYSVEQCYETSGLFVGDSMDGLATIPALHHEPPPSYDAVVAMQEQQQLLLQQHQQQLLMLQQQQQLATTNSPPPGYRSSVDVSSIMQQGGRGTSLGSGFTIGGSIMSGIEINSLASSSANLRTTNSISPVDPSLNDVNGNVAAMGTLATATPTNCRSAPCYMRNKQPRNINANQISQLNMKKVLQAQSCCSLQRAEVENMWNAAAAALAARSAHLASDSRASTTASASSPTLAMSTRKSYQNCKNSNSNTPETFGGRYLKQNYYRRGCPLCGKFRYDDSNLSISIESNLDSLAGALTEQIIMGEGHNDNLMTTQNNNVNENLTGRAENLSALEDPNIEEENNNDDETSEDEVDNNITEIEQQCSCGHTKQSIEASSTNSQQNLNFQMQNIEKNDTEEQINETEFGISDDNANSVIQTARQSNNQLASNNNNDIAASNELPTTSAAANTLLPCSSTVTAANTISAVSTPSSTIDLDCINENGIISLDMSKIIDKTGLPTYDAALKLESSGYV